MGLNETRMNVPILPGNAEAQAVGTTVVTLDLSPYVGQVMTFQADGGEIFFAAGPSTAACTASVATSLSLADGERWHALVTRDRLVLKMIATASGRTMKYAVTG